jgi:multiple sugar transport system ATP-binding protein
LAFAPKTSRTQRSPRTRRKTGGSAAGSFCREALGSEIQAHFNIDARPALTDDVRELAADVGEELIDQAPHTTMVGRFGAGSGVRQGQEAEVAVDTQALQFFDPDTGAGIYDSNSKGATT